MKKSLLTAGLLSVLFSISLLCTSCATANKSKDTNVPFVNPYSVEFEPIEKVEISEKSYQEFIISPQGNSKKQLKAGGYYDFTIGPYNTKYIILSVHCISGQYDWHVLENDGTNYFSCKMQIAGDGLQLVVAHSSDKNHYEDSYKNIQIYQGSTSIYPISKKDNVSHVVINSPFIGDSKGSLYAGEFCKFDIGPSISPYCVIAMKINRKSNKWIVMNNDGSNYFSTFQLIPDNVKSISIAYTDSPNYYNSRIFHVSTKKSKNPYTFQTIEYSSEQFKGLKTNAPDKNIIAFMDSINARKLGKDDADLLIEKTVEYIKSISKNDFQTVKYIHDAIWYMVSYDDDSLMHKIEHPQDYKTVLSRGLSVCAGFSNVFSQFCKVAGIIELPVNGYARGTGWGGEKWSPKDDPTKSNHAWNMVNVDGYWYLVDVTWDCGSTTNGIRNDYYSNRYLFPNPEIFIYSHYPLNQQYQLLDDPYKPKEFSQLPDREPNMY